jgi:hypothetical protein
LTVRHALARGRLPSHRVDQSATRDSGVQEPSRPCDYVLVTNGDNLYARALFRHTCPHLRRRAGLVGFFFSSHYPYSHAYVAQGRVERSGPDGVCCASTPCRLEPPLVHLLPINSSYSHHLLIRVSVYSPVQDAPRQELGRPWRRAYAGRLDACSSRATAWISLRGLRGMARGRRTLCAARGQRGY